MSKLFVDEIVHQSSQGSGTITLGASGENITIPSGVTMTNNGSVSGTSTNYPAFGLNFNGANLPSAQNTWTKIPSANITMVYNVGSAFDSSNSRFTVPSGYAGKYIFHVKFLGNNNTNVYRGEFYKNGSTTYNTTNGVTSQARTSEGDSGYGQVENTLFIDLAVGDYIEFYIRNSTGANTIYTAGSAAYNYFMGYRLIGI